jgi:hypothetical protein
LCPARAAFSLGALPVRKQDGVLLKALRALAGSQGRVRELGAPPTYTEEQCRRVERQQRRAELAFARARAPGMLASAVGVGAVSAVLVGSVSLALEAGGALAVFMLGLALLPNPQRRAPWRQWREHRRRMTAGLRALGDGWTILWDRRLQSAPTPVTIALGDSGVWVLWIPEPEWAAQNPHRVLDELVAEIAGNLGSPGFALHAHALYTPAHVAEVLDLMFAGVPQAGQDQLRDWAERIDLNTLQEPIVIPAA